MTTRNRNWNHNYRLIMADDGQGVARTIEFEAAGPEAALYMAQQQCQGREAELVEDGRSLGRVQCVAHGGYWRLLPPVESSFGFVESASAAASARR